MTSPKTLCKSEEAGLELDLLPHVPISWFLSPAVGLFCILCNYGPIVWSVLPRGYKHLKAKAVAEKERKGLFTAEGFKFLSKGALP